MQALIFLLYEEIKLPILDKIYQISFNITVFSKKKRSSLYESLLFHEISKFFLKKEDVSALIFFRVSTNCCQFVHTFSNLTSVFFGISTEVQFSWVQQICFLLRPSSACLFSIASLVKYTNFDAIYKNTERQIII